MLSRALLKLSKRVFGEVIVPGDPDFTSECRLFNRALNIKPAVIIKVKDSNDVVHALAYARSVSMSVSIRGGGHSVCGGCIVNGGMLLDMRDLDDITVLSDKRRVVVQAGALLHQVDAVTQPYGLALPQGTCPTVGVVGSSLGGGVGFLSRKYGMICDCIRRIIMITANGDYIELDDQHHTDLFWAMRGAGANQFGVVIEVEYEIFPVPEKIYGGTICWPIAHGKTVLRKYQELHASASNNVFMYAFMPHAKQSDAVVSLFGFSMESIQCSKAMFDDMRGWAPVVSEDLSERSYQDLQSAHYETELAIHWRHGFIKQALTENFIDKCLSSFAKCPDNAGGIMFDPLGGAINEVDVSATAFLHRDSQFICSVTGLHGGDQLPDATTNWVEDTYDALSPYFSDAAYQNYEDTTLDEPLCYYGQHLARLLQIKTQYDPNGLFVGKLT